MKTPQVSVIRQLLDNQVVGALEIEQAFAKVPDSAFTGGAESALEILAMAGELTPFQVARILDGKITELIMGNYVVLSKLGSGGMGSVFKARHRRMKRIVALKMLNKEMLDSPASLQRFQREVESIAKLMHPGVVAAYDADEGPLGHFLVMEYVEGNDLLNLVAKNGPFSVPRAVDTIVQAARAMAYVHSRGLIHRDIKPANFLVDGSGNVKVADLGLVRVEKESDGSSSSTETEGLTQACTIAGTLEYMAPEQAMDTKTADARADIYSLGCTLWYLLTAKVVYPADTQMKKVLAHQNAPIPSLRQFRPDAPAPLEFVFRKMLAKSITDRYQTMDEVVVDLEKVARGLGGDMPPPAAVDDAGATMMVDKDELLGHFAKGASSPPPGTAIMQNLMARSPRTGLLVEPSRTQAMMIGRQLEQAGLSPIHKVASGGSALEALRDHPIGLVVSTYHLPDMTGAELLHRIRDDADFAGIRFLLISSLDDAPPMVADPAMAQLHKPFTPDQLAQSVQRLQGTEARTPATMKVLLADDSPSARRRMRGALTEVGFVDIVEAPDGKQAARLAEEHRFDLICTDFQMPEMTGGEFTAHARRVGLNTKTPILMCTSETDPQLLEGVYKAGVNRLVGKTASTRDLTDAIRALAGV